MPDLIILHLPRKILKIPLVFDAASFEIFEIVIVVMSVPPLIYTHGYNLR